MPSSTTRQVSRGATFFASGLCALWVSSLASSGVTAQAQQPSTLNIAPADQTISIGQTQQFAANGAVTPNDVSAGGEYACAGLSDGTVQCTGRNQFGQLANGTWDNSSLLVSSVNLAGVSRVAAGDEFGCALMANGTARCWGLGESGQRGDGTYTNLSNVPAEVIGLTGAIALASGYDHACALLADGTMRCWGSNVFGQLGDPSTGTSGSAVPVVVSGVSGVVSFTTGAYHTCAVLADATLRCWGKNDNGQLGDGTRTSSVTPVVVSGLNGVASVRGGGDHTCALLQDGTVQCWGENEYGQLGNGTTSPSMTPSPVTGLTDGVAIASGWRHDCAVLASGSVQCWGQNDFGELGIGTAASSSTPATVLGIATAAGITAGWWHHTCALLAGGAVECWGANEWGQLGNGTTANSSTPEKMTGSGVTWTSSNPTVATIDESGRATALNSGTTTITAADSSGATASTTLTVRARFALSLATAGAGAGNVTWDPAGISGGTDSSELYDSGTTVTITAMPDSRSTFAGWTGCDTTSAATCTVTMNAARTVTATFDLKTFALTVAKSGIGAGNGRVSSSPQGIDCGANCSGTYTIDTVVTLTASPALLFSGWTGCDLVSGPTCTVTIESARSVTASFLALPSISADQALEAMGSVR